jgi:hypothetical protein
MRPSSGSQLKVIPNFRNPDFLRSALTNRTSAVSSLGLGTLATCTHQPSEVAAQRLEHAAMVQAAGIAAVDQRYTTDSAPALGAFGSRYVKRVEFRVGRSFRNANQVTVVGRSINLRPRSWV